MAPLNETSTEHEVQCQVQDQHLGELLGRLVDAETKMNILGLQNNKLQEMLTDYEDTKEKLKELKADFAALKSNADAFEAAMKEARADRQAAQEELAALKAPKAKRKRKVVRNGKHDQAQTL
tara:strand:+ start:141 stop:506 length:366 start_codon:yes stop_codon:yes gene_type:complete